MNGQHWDATDQRLSFSFAEESPVTLPFATAFAVERVELETIGTSWSALRVEVTAGELNLQHLLYDGSHFIVFDKTFNY
jgi:hypothetical protein